MNPQLGESHHKYNCDTSAVNVNFTINKMQRTTGTETLSEDSVNVMDGDDPV